MDSNICATVSVVSRTYYRKVRKVVPDVGLLFVGCHGDGSLEALEGHVVLLGVEAAQTEVVEELHVVDAHLYQAPAARKTTFSITCFFFFLHVFIENK